MDATADPAALLSQLADEKARRARLNADLLEARAQLQAAREAAAAQLRELEALRESHAQRLQEAEVGDALMLEKDRLLHDAIFQKDCALGDVAELQAQLAQLRQGGAADSDGGGVSAPSSPALSSMVRHAAGTGTVEAAAAAAAAAAEVASLRAQLASLATVLQRHSDDLAAERAAHARSTAAVSALTAEAAALSTAAAAAARLSEVLAESRAALAVHSKRADAAEALAADTASQLAAAHLATAAARAELDTAIADADALRTDLGQATAFGGALLESNRDLGRALRALQAPPPAGASQPPQSAQDLRPQQLSSGADASSRSIALVAAELDAAIEALTTVPHPLATLLHAAQTQTQTPHAHTPQAHTPPSRLASARRAVAPVFGTASSTALAGLVTAVPSQNPSSGGGGGGGGLPELSSLSQRVGELLSLLMQARESGNAAQPPPPPHVLQQPSPQVPDAQLQEESLPEPRLLTRYPSSLALQPRLRPHPQTAMAPGVLPAPVPAASATAAATTAQSLLLPSSPFAAEEGALRAERSRRQEAESELAALQSTLDELLGASSEAAALAAPSPPRRLV